MMNVSIHKTAAEANDAAAELLAGWLANPATRNVMPAAGNTPLEVYRRIAAKKLPVNHVRLFTLDEYVGVPVQEPRNCSNLLRRTVLEAWRIPPNQFFWISSNERDALSSVLQHEARIKRAGELDVIILGLGQNGHLGFNEPGSEEDSGARVLALESISTEANRLWFGGDYAPSQGVTVGLRTILAARQVLIMAYGPHKTAAVKAMLEGPRGPQCPASFLQTHQRVHLFLDEAAAAGLTGTGHA